MADDCILVRTGKELLKPELPLCIRLIGLRVTKLKDLRAPADQGIKRVRRLSIVHPTTILISCLFRHIWLSVVFSSQRDQPRSIRAFAKEA